MPCSTANCFVWDNEQLIRVSSGEKLQFRLIPGAVCIVSDCGVCVDSMDPTLKIYIDGNKAYIGYEYHKCGDITLTFDGYGRARLLLWAWCGPGHPTWCKWVTLEVEQTGSTSTPTQPTTQPTQPTQQTSTPSVTVESVGSVNAATVAIAIGVAAAVGYGIYRLIERIGKR